MRSGECSWRIFYRVTLPPAKTAFGMMVFIKRADTTFNSSNAVKVAPNGTDKIENLSSITLKKQFDSLELISDGSGVWYIFDSSKCSLFIS